MNTENTTPNKYERVKKIIEKYSPNNYSIILGIPVILFVIGFSLWSIYLYTFGFIEKEILRGQFILTGLFFILCSVIPLTLFSILSDFLRSLRLKLLSFLPVFIKNKIENSWVPYRDILQLIRFLIYSVIFIGWLLFYVTQIFPAIPNFLGGGQPRALSLLVNDENHLMLKSLGIDTAEGAKHQTENMCIIYEDKEEIFILRNDRILALSKSLFQGFGSVPVLKTQVEQVCIIYATQRSLESIRFGFLLSKTSIENAVAGIFGYPPRFFDIKFSTTSVGNK